MNSTDTMQNHTPQLRFDKYDKSWLLKKLINWDIKVIDGDRGVNYPNKKDFIPNGYCVFLNAKNVTKSGFSFLDKMYISKEKDESLNKGKLKRSDLILTTRGSVGHLAFYSKDVEFDNLRINSGMVILRNENSIVDSYFNYFNFQSTRIIKQIKTIAFGSAQPQLTVKEINKITIGAPSLPEQKKIASFLSAVDKKIQQLSKKKELLEEYKKGLMQKLFSGDLRFKNEDGKAYPDWEEKRIGDLTSVIAGGTPKTMKKGYWNGDIRWMNSGELNLKIVYEVKNRITKEGLKNSATKLIPKNCILIGLAGQGKTRGTAAINMVELCTNQSIASILPNYELFEPKYLYQNIDNRYQELRNLSTGDGGRGGLNLSIIKSFKIPLPSVEEQKRIAEFLSIIDLKIENNIEQITQTQIFKKGLLQQMFV